MDPQLAAVVAAFRRRLAIGGFVRGAGRALLVCGLAVALGVLAARLCAVSLVPTPWLLLLAVPIVAVAVWQLQRDRLPTAVILQHLDTRLQAGGLLLSAGDGVPLPDGWTRQLGDLLRAAPAGLPTVRWREALLRPLLVAGLAAAVLAWPRAPRAAAGEVSFAGASALERLGDDLRQLEQQPGVLPAAVAAELREQLAQLQERVAAGDPAVWREIDALAERLQREQLLAAASAGEAASGAAALRDAAAAAIATAAQALFAAGGGGGLPESLRAAMAAAAAAGQEFDPQQLGLDPQQLRQLASALEGALEQLAARTGSQLGAAQLAELQRLVAAAAEAGAHAVVRHDAGLAAASQPGQGPEGGAVEGTPVGGGSAAGGVGPEGADGVGGDGRGGVGRGPGFAALRLTEHAAGGADGAFVLPPGAVIPDRWVPLGERQVAPDVQPNRSAAAGSAAATGRGGASWQLQLAPRHRAVVQRYFGRDAATSQERR